jgi:hypothetical protein
MYSEELKSNENTFWNWFFILIAIIIIWYIFFTTKENYVSNLSKFRSENEDRKMKIIQKINGVSKAMGDSQYSNYTQVPDTQYRQYSTSPLDNTDTANNNITSGTTDAKLSKNIPYHNLDTQKPFISSNMSVDMGQSGQNSSNNTNNTADGSTKWMNQIGFIDRENVSCNMLGVNSAAIDDFKKKFYSKYSHQIECPAKCGMSANGMSKGCGMGSKSGLNKDCQNVNTPTSIPDTFAINYLALDNANKKPCVTCNFKPTKNQLNREWMEKVSYPYDGLPEDVRIADEARLKKLNLIDANVSNYANFNNNVYQDSVGESAPDRINELRTCQDAYGTCKLSDYGSTIANAYDKLTANPAYTSRNDNNPYQLTGVLEDAASTDMYAKL